MCKSVFRVDLPERYDDFLSALIDGVFALDWEFIQAPLSSGFPNKAIEN